jgi:hypothetical protein
MNQYSRNPFEALCEVASQYDWCWKIVCTTCGHSAFKIAFAKLVQDQHPDNPDFFPYGKESYHLDEQPRYNTFSYSGREKLQDQLKLASIVAEASIENIQLVAKFPDWLGYLGLVLHHCPSEPAQKILSEAFLPQFMSLSQLGIELKDYFLNKHKNGEFLTIEDLEKIEHGLFDINKHSV